MDFVLRGPTVQYPNEQFGQHMFNHLSNRKPSDIIAVNSETGESITCANLQDSIVKTACALKSFVGQEDVVALIGENEIKSIFPLVASLYLGTAITLLNTSYNIREITKNFHQSKPKVVFCSERCKKSVLEVKRNVDFIELVVVLGAEACDEVSTIYDFMDTANNNSVTDFRPAVLKDDNQTAVILSSSGTSGLPKGVMLTYANLSASIPFMTGETFVGISLKTVLVLVPIFHVFGCFAVIYGTGFSSRLVLMQKFVPNAFLQTLQDRQIDMLLIVPQLASFLAKHPIVDDYDLSSVKDIICGAAPVAQNILDLIKTRLEIHVRQAYGLTEATGTAFTPGKATKPNSCGLICPNLALKIQDVDTGKSLPANVLGEICFKGPTVMKGYIDNPKATSDSFDADGYLLTGDLGYYDEDGFLYIVDRLKDMIKCKGFQVAPSELEDVLLSHPGVKEAAVIGIPHQRAGEVPLGFVVRQPDSDVSEVELIDFITERVSESKRLTGGVKFLESIPRNASGKILKRILRENILLCSQGRI